MSADPTIRSAAAEDAEWIATASTAIGGPRVVSGGVLHDLMEHPALVAENRSDPVGLLVWRDERETREVLALRADPEGAGTGRALMTACCRDAAARGLARVALDTTNDNLRAQGFYQRFGFRLASVRIGGFAEVLRLKSLPDTPAPVGQNGIPLRDILRLQLAL